VLKNSQQLYLRAAPGAVALRNISPSALVLKNGQQLYLRAAPGAVALRNIETYLPLRWW
jgi:hypothetical protein